MLSERGQITGSRSLVPGPKRCLSTFEFQQRETPPVTARIPMRGTLCIRGILMLPKRLRYSLAPAPSSPARAAAELPWRTGQPIAKLQHREYRLITRRMHHRRARVTRSVKNLSLNAITLISGLKVTHPILGKQCAGQLFRPSCVWQKKPCFCRTKASTLDYPSMSKIG